MKIIYFYTSNGAADSNSDIKWNDKIKTINSFAHQIWTEGPFVMLDKMVELGYFDEQIVFIDSTRSPGYLQITPRSKVYVVPHLSESLKYINQGDIIYARGGFKPWYSTLQTLANKKHWIMFYRANTNRNPWPFWDIILDDLIDTCDQSSGRLVYNFSKPINEDLFRPSIVDRNKKIYDIMIGASHIHVKKGQHVTIQALHKYKEMFGNVPKICLPGSFIKSWSNQIIFDEMNQKNLHIDFLGFLDRPQLCNLMGKTKLFLHFGSGGQNDRGVLEAMSCGMPVMIASPERFSSFVFRNKKMSRVISSTIRLDNIAKEIKSMLDDYNNGGFKDVWDYYIESNGMEKVCIPKMARLVKFIKDNPIPNRPKLLKEFL